MKKVFFSLAVLCSVALVSCGGNKAAETADTDTIVAEEVAVVVDSNDSNAAADTTVVAAAEEVVAPETAK